MSTPTVRGRLLLPLVAVATVVVVAGCSTGASSIGTPQDDAGGSSTSAPAATPDVAGQKFPDVVGVEISGERSAGLGFAVTISSPYDTPDRYADGIRVRSADGMVYGDSTLTHDHASEQPFTRSVTGVKIPDGVTEVLVEGRDQANGWGGGTKTVTLP